MPEFRRAMKRNARMLDGIGMFSDDIRDMVRGHVFYNKDCGYVSGKEKMKVAVRYCAAGGVWHPQVDYAAYTYAAGGTWTDTPEKVINYVSCHDNLTLWDKLQISRPDCDAGVRLAMNRLAAAMVFTAQGVPFFLGEKSLHEPNRPEKMVRYPRTVIICRMKQMCCAMTGMMNRKNCSSITED